MQTFLRMSAKMPRLNGRTRAVLFSCLLAATLAVVALGGFTTNAKASKITYLYTDEYGFTYWHSEGSSAGSYDYRCDPGGGCEEWTQIN